MVQTTYNYGECGIELLLMKQSSLVITVDPESLIQFPSASVIRIVCATLSRLYYRRWR